MKNKSRLEESHQVSNNTLMKSKRRIEFDSVLSRIEDHSKLKTDSYDIKVTRNSASTDSEGQHRNQRRTTMMGTTNKNTIFTHEISLENTAKIGKRNMSVTVSKQLINLATIPDAVRLKPDNLNDTMGPNSLRDFNQTRHSFTIRTATSKPKKVE
jgi:hypothetical protein